MSFQQRINTGALLFMALSCFAFSLLYSFYNFMPMSHWVKYHKVKPEKEAFKTGEQLRFVSSREVFRECSLSFTDILYCKDLDGNFEIKKLFVSSSEFNKPTKGITHRSWPYEKTIRYETECYLDTTITLKHIFGLTAKQNLVGPVFKIVSE